MRRRFIEPVSRVLVLLIALSWCVPRSLAASPEVSERGSPIVTTWDGQDYGAHPQNWAITQDPRGIMYFGNTDGVLEYDGVSWRLVKVSNDSIVRSLAAADGTVYVGAVGEVGFLQEDGSGGLDYVSLVDQLPSEARGFADVWRTLATEDGIFFWTYSGFLRWQGEAFEFFEIETHWVPEAVDGKLYYNDAERGLQVFDEGIFRQVAGGEPLAAVRVNLILPADGGALLLGTREGGGKLFKLYPPGAAPEADGELLVDFPTAADDYLREHRLYTGTRLIDGGYLLATMDGGAVVVGPDGNWRELLDRSHGLPDNSVWAAFRDRQGSVWLGLNRGLAHLEVGAPLSVFDETSGLEGTVETIARHGGRLYVGTSTGLFRLSDTGFERIPGLAPPCWDIVALSPPGGGAERLLVGSNGGVFELGEGAPRQILDIPNTFQLHLSRHEPGTVYVGTSEGLTVLRFASGSWQQETRVVGIDEQIRSIAEDASGDVWLGTHFQGVIRWNPASGEIVRFGTDDGLSDLTSIKIDSLGDELIFGGAFGLLRFDSAAGRFVDSQLLEAQASILRLAVDGEQNLWLSLDELSPAVARRRVDGSYEVENVDLRRLPHGLWYALYPEDDGVFWIGGTAGLFRLDIRPETGVDPDFRTLIRSVSKRDGTALGGLEPAAEAPRLTYAENSLALRFTATSFCDVERNAFRYRLEGFEDDWSPWTSEHRKEYTNLREGDYRFRVQAKNVFGTLGREAEYRFVVEPPWYRTLPFLTLVAVLLGALLWLAYRALVRRARRIQREVSEREQAAEREHLISRLEASNAELERFAYTVSHDLKAPLVTIRGFLGFLKKDAAQGNFERMEEDLERIEGAAGKMQVLLDDMLELSRVGRKSKPRQDVAFADLVAEALLLTEGQRQRLGVEVIVESDLPRVNVDRAQIVTVLQNLLENAEKYMGDQSAPRVEVGARDQDGETVFYVSDNGVGIDPRFHKSVFGLFERLDSDTPGTGVGLALVKRVVEHHGGRIWIESEGQGRGATFCFTLPPALGDSS